LIIYLGRDALVGLEGSLLLSHMTPCNTDPRGPRRLYLLHPDNFTLAKSDDGITSLKYGACVLRSLQSSSI